VVHNSGSIQINVYSLTVAQWNNPSASCASPSGADVIVTVPANITIGGQIDNVLYANQASLISVPWQHVSSDPVRYTFTNVQLCGGFTTSPNDILILSNVDMLSGISPGLNAHSSLGQSQKKRRRPARFPLLLLAFVFQY
jgi:hypothetical protein